ncbi:DUF4136 domain-containing protein [Helicobacter cinaedi]|uniref:DUF4136 domain-containing protein n=1 Tax=Helicobacter cinaedi TaxID=213 RepID=UPI000DA1D56A|nr:DUF4136 domain-containing protein [Helicobacter cinaedi]
MKKVFITGLLVFIINGCAILKPTQVNKLQDTSMYRYAIVGQTQTLTSGSGAVYMGYGTGGGFGASSSKSINPADVISGILMKKGFVILSSPNDKPTLLVQYGQGDKRNVLGGLGGYTLSVTIQMLDSKTHDLVFTCSAEGQGDTEADDVRQAIERCLKDF